MKTFKTFLANAAILTTGLSVVPSVAYAESVPSNFLGTWTMGNGVTPDVTVTPHTISHSDNGGTCDILHVAPGFNESGFDVIKVKYRCPNFTANEVWNLFKIDGKSFMVVTFPGRTLKTDETMDLYVLKTAGPKH